jgi:hypothetical protein
MSKRQRRRQQKQRRHEGRAPSKRQIALGAGVTISATIAMGGVAHAGSFEVNSLGDGSDDTLDGTCETATSGECTLRAALEEANDDPSDDFITFASGLTGTINLTSGLPNIAYDPMYIYGPGAGTLAVNGQGNNIIYSDRASGSEGNTLFIEGLTLTGGYSPGGGAITNFDSSVIVGNSVISGNSALGGGGIYNSTDGYGTYGRLTVYSSTLSGNDAQSGGAILSFGLGGVYASTLGPDNTALSGGGLTTQNNYAFSGYFTVDNSTVSGNTAYITGGGVYDGREPYYHLGAHYHVGGLSLNNSTIANNYADGDGGGIYENPANDPGTSYFFNGPYSPYPFTYNTIIGDNSASGQGPDAFGTLFSGFTLLENATDATVISSDPNKIGVDPQLFPLASNGGPTQTQELAPTSPAVDQGSSEDSYDQRGAQRPFDFSTIANAADASDMGAFELQPGDIAVAGGAAVTAPKCKGKAATVFRPNGRTLSGTNKRDVIVGTSKKDKINSRGGNDLVCAKGGNDTVNGGGGKDKLYGQGGKDKLKGAGGNDKLVGGGGKDKLIGGGGADKLLGKGGNDVCIGGAGNDVEKSC